MTLNELVNTLYKRLNDMSDFNGDKKILKTELMLIYHEIIDIILEEVEEVEEDMYLNNKAVSKDIRVPLMGKFRLSQKRHTIGLNLKHVYEVPGHATRNIVRIHITPGTKLRKSMNKHNPDFKKKK